MLILDTLPNLEDTPANREFRQFFYSKWGRETCIISARARHGAYPEFEQCLSIKAAWGGAELYYLEGRTIAVDDDNYFVINERRTYASAISSVVPVHSFSIFFRPGLAEEALGGLLTPLDRLLETEEEPRARPTEFAEVLHRHDSQVSPILRYIAYEVDRGLDDELWYEEQLSFLLERILRIHRAAILATGSLANARQITRREVIRRIGWSTDYMNTNYARALTADDLARSACMSKFHFIRLFRAVHGVTPFAYLQRKRAEVAKRLLVSTRLTLDDVATRAGFDSKSTLYRQLRRLTGSTARSLRRQSLVGDSLH